MADNQEKKSHWGECLENQILQMAAKFLCSDNPKCLCVLGLGSPPQLLSAVLGWK